MNIIETKVWKHPTCPVDFWNVIKISEKAPEEWIKLTTLVVYMMELENIYGSENSKYIKGGENDLVIEPRTCWLMTCANVRYIDLTQAMLKISHTYKKCLHTRWFHKICGIFFFRLLVQIIFLIWQQFILSERTTFISRSDLRNFTIISYTEKVNICSNLETAIRLPYYTKN